MRAREFTINVPINIKINGDGDPEIDVPSSDSVDPSELDPNPIYISPLQQDLELRKAEVGKNSDVIQDLTQDEFKDTLSSDELVRVREILGKLV
jgi:hypothetical protein